MDKTESNYELIQCGQKLKDCVGSLWATQIRNPCAGVISTMIEVTVLLAFTESNGYFLYK